MGSDLIERASLLAANIRKVHPHRAPTADFLDELRTALATEREAREKVEKERDELLLALDRCPAGPVELRAQLSYDRHRAEAAESSLAEARRLLTEIAEYNSGDGEVLGALYTLGQIRSSARRFLSQEAER